MDELLNLLAHRFIKEATESRQEDPELASAAREAGISARYLSVRLQADSGLDDVANEVLALWLKDHKEV